MTTAYVFAPCREGEHPFCAEARRGETGPEFCDCTCHSELDDTSEEDEQYKERRDEELRQEER